MHHALRSLALSVAVALFASGCHATSYHPGPATAFDAHPAREITDEDIRAAFGARPQLGDRVRVAYFSYDPARVDAIESAFRAMPRVEDVYRIPALLVTGHRRYDEPRPWDPPREVNVHQLRLLAARARCDVLVVFDYGHRVERRPNGYAALNVLLVPALFAPFVDARVESYLDAFVLDVRNGYLYRHTSATERGEVTRLNIWSEADRALIERQWTALLVETRRELDRALDEGRAPALTAAHEGPQRVVQRTRLSMR